MTCQVVALRVVRTGTGIFLCSPCLVYLILVRSCSGSIQEEQQGGEHPDRSASAELCRPGPQSCCPGSQWEPCLQPTLDLLGKLSLLASHLARLAENSSVFAKTYTQGLDSTMLHQQLVIKLTRADCLLKEKGEIMV